VTGGPARSRRDRGSTAIELAILAPSVLAFFVTALIAGRYSLAQQAADAAAFDAARTASLARTEPEARSQARTAALASFAAQGVECRTPATADVDTDGFRVDEGQPATVSVTVHCDLEFRDISLPFLPRSLGTIELSSSFVSPLDTYRSRS